MINNIPVDRKNEIEVVKDTLGYTPYPASKNLLENTATSKTTNGITYTVNDDGSVIANGTATAVQVGININPNTRWLPEGEYILSGCPEGGSIDTYCLRIVDGTTNGTIVDYGEGVRFTSNGENDYTVQILVMKKDVKVENLTFYPMIRKADVTDDTYEMYYEAKEDVDTRFNDVDTRLNSVKSDIASVLEWKTLTSFSTSEKIFTPPSNYSEICLYYWENVAFYSVVIPKSQFEVAINKTVTQKFILGDNAGSTAYIVSVYTYQGTYRIKSSVGTMYALYR